MNTILLDISEKIKPHNYAVLTAVYRSTQKLGIEFIVVGAGVRDFILSDGYGISTPVATYDVDIGVYVSSWAEFEKLINLLIADENFIKTNYEHRLVLPSIPGAMLDILPFGAIESPQRIVMWRQTENEMNMTGFSEAFRAAVSIKIASSPLIIVKMLSLAGLALLKLLSWNENPDMRDRDAKDFGLIMKYYLDVQQPDYVHNTHADIASAGDYDSISARCLGRDIAAIAGSEITRKLIDILNKESNVDGNLRFVLQMTQSTIGEEIGYNRICDLLNTVSIGLVD
jgi:predicted nucleotidyltransferase